MVASLFGLGYSARSRVGEATGPNPTDRGRGTNRHLGVDKNGIPWAVTLSAANVHDSRSMETTLGALEPIQPLRGRPRKRSEKRSADKTDDAAEKRCWL